MEIKIIPLILFIPVVFGINISHLELSQENKNLVEAFKIIRNDLRKNYNTKSCALLTIADPLYSETHEALKLDILKNVFNNEFIKLRVAKLPSPKQYRFSVILVDNMKVFRKSDKFIDAKTFHYSGYHIIIMLNATLNEVQEIFTHFWTKNIYNVFVLLNIHKESLLLTFEPFENIENCGNTSAKVVNSFKNGKFTKKIGPWKKFQNMNRCPITVTTYANNVAVFKRTLPDGSSFLHGYEYEMIQHIAETLNFTLDLVYREGKQEWGIVFENGTCTRGFEHLKDRKTDILLGDLFLKELRVKYFDPSAPYLNYPLLFVLSPQPKLNMFQKLLNPFDFIVWIFIFLILCVGVAMILVINLKYKFMKSTVYGEGVNHPVTNLYTTFIGQSQTPLPRRNFARIILMTFLVFSLIIRSAYQGSLYKFLQSDGTQKEPQTIDEVIEKKYTFIIAKTNVDIAKDSYPKMYSASYIMEENDEVDLDVALKWFERTASFASRTTLMNYSLTNDNFPYKICKEDFLTFNIVMFYNKNFFLKSAIDEAIQKMLVHGFMDHWIKEYDKTDKWRFTSIKPTVMTFDHLSGSFSLLLIGCILSSLIFVLEILYFKLIFTVN